jgi:uncharacterized hydrophobic protein (TIGR00271 family)
MVHLRIVVPSYQAEHTLDLLNATPSVCNLVYLERAARKPEGDMILCDVAREDASVIISDLRELNIDREGSIAMETIDSQISSAAVAAEKAAVGLPSDAVVWEEVEARTSENVELSANFLAFMVLAMLIAMIGILTDQLILIIGAMIVGPEFGPIAGLCVAAVEKRRDLFKRSFKALAIGFPAGISVVFVAMLLIDALGKVPGDFSQQGHPFTQFISSPDGWSFFVAYLAGMAGVLSLTSTKSGALIGVLISVTTIPAASNIGVAAALGDGHEWVGAMEQLSLNLSAIMLAGIGTLFIQRRLYVRRRLAHLHDESREAGGLPLGESRRGRQEATAGGTAARRP